MADLFTLEPVATLVARVRAELSADFDFSRPVRISRAPGRLDVMGGIADYTGSLVCEATLDRAAAVAIQPRADRQVQVFSFNLLDEHQPFTLRVPLEALAGRTTQELRREFSEPGRKFAGYLAGCLHVMHKRGLIDLQAASATGFSIALLSSVPLGAGVSSSAAIEVATMINLADHFGLRAAGRIDPMTMAAMCQEVENQVVGAPCGIMDQATSVAGTSGTLLRLLCQPHQLQPPLRLPEGVRVIGINSNVKHSVGGGQYGKTRCAAFMGHAIILAKMREVGAGLARPLARDPMNGYLANLDPDDYKQRFRPLIPEEIRGEAFLARFGPTIDGATRVEPEVVYRVQQASDHHVLEARRVKNFVGFLEQAGALDAGDRKRKGLLDKAGHLMYASHISYTNDALLGAAECDTLVGLVRAREHAGLYGAKITGGGSGGTVAVLADVSERVDATVREIMEEYQKQTGRKAEAFWGSSAGAWEAGTSVLAR